MKKILLSLSALTIGATPAVSLLNVGQKQVITVVTSEIQKKIDETSVLFKAPTITNAQKQNSTVTTNWLNDQKVSNISNIDSSLSYSEYNKTIYDMKSADKTLNKLYKDKDYNHKNEDASTELIFGTADKGLSLLENSIDENGLKAEGINEVLNWISYVSFGAGVAGKLNAKSIDKSILKLNEKIGWLSAFKNTPVPTLSKLNNEYGVYTFQDLQDFISISIANLLAEASGFEGTFKTVGSKNKKYNEVVTKKLNLKDAKIVVDNKGNANPIKVPSGGWAPPYNVDNKKNYSPNDTRTLLKMQKDFYQALILHILDGENVSFNFKLNAENMVEIINLIYSLSWYISSYDKYVNENPKDDNYLFSSTETNISIFEKNKEVKLTKQDIESKGLDGILKLFKSLLVKGDSNSSRRVLKILFQPTDTVTPSWNEDAKLKLVQLWPPAGPGFYGNWSKNNQNNGLTLLINNLVIGLFQSNKFKTALKIPESLAWLLGESTGSTIGNMLNSILADNDNKYFFDKMSSDFILDTLIGAFVKDLKTYLAKIGEMAKDGAFTNTISKIFTTKLNVLMDYIGSIMDVFSPPAATDPPRQPSTLPKTSILELMNIGVMGITIGNVIWSGLNFINTSLSEIMKPLGLLGALISDDVSKNYTFYVKDKENQDSKISLEELLGYNPGDVFEKNTKTSDLAIVWSMMRFVNTDKGKNKVVGVAPNNSNGTSGEIIYGHKAWKMLLGLNYDQMSYYDNSLLYWMNELLTNGLTAKIIQWPIKMSRKYVDYNLSDITYNRNKKMNYWSNKDLFSTQFISYQEDSKQEVINYKIIYKIKKDVYNTYEVSVYKEHSSSKYKINSFSKI
ncbi:hypothetical protein [Mesoplasma tabanidae]|uniref:MOLPALP family lipoprotein n=1 Tax=Mesoplasma tabanidae TaxID=219745 RepID=A0A2K8P3N8_9MOLU|nr:hypothetical protein [Mesoplasma tabanidae]ATZ21367.1 hypothetical protein MTABA_v1c01630 [Mesoplasma tabanidae]